jgi:hypothetical protein
MFGGAIGYRIWGSLGAEGQSEEKIFKISRGLVQDLFLYGPSKADSSFIGAE